MLMAQENMKGDSVLLNVADAFALANQFHETASYRNWELQALAIMCSHIHIVVGVPGDPDPATLLKSFKSYGSRRLNEHDVKPSSGTWWTESGSRRKLPDRNAVANAVAYVRDQESPLWIWIHPLWEAELGPRFPRHE
jgi:REP element-mobilizing transposase RayT